MAQLFLKGAGDHQVVDSLRLHSRQLWMLFPCSISQKEFCHAAPATGGR
jgi:hypothetical protein